jgi:small-conductance mechanosensitive channel
LLWSPQVQAGMLALVLVLVALWFLWAMIPHWLRKIIRQSRRPREGRNEH